MCLCFISDWLLFADICYLFSDILKINTISAFFDLFFSVGMLWCNLIVFLMMSGWLTGISFLMLRTLNSFLDI